MGNDIGWGNAMLPMEGIARTRAYRLVVVSVAAVSAIQELVLTNHGYGVGICFLVAAMIALGTALLVMTPFAGSMALLSMEIAAVILQVPVPAVGALLLALAGGVGVCAYPLAGVPLTAIECALGAGLGHTAVFGATGESARWLYVACAMGSISGGLLLRSRQRQKVLVDEVQAHGEQRRLARLLHDQVANDINDIVMLAERRLESGPDVQVERMRSVAQQALAGVRQVIVSLEGDGVSVTPPPAASACSGTMDFDAVCMRAQEYHDRLEAAGFPGELMVFGDHARHVPQSALLADVLHELAGNITKYAARDESYCMVLSCTESQVGIGLTNLVRDRSEAAPGLGTGMRGLDCRIREIGGSVEAAWEGSYWNYHAGIPMK